MEPLDLSTCPPRSGLEKLGGFYLLARTIDKIRAHLPDGNPGEYKIPGFSERLLQALGVSEYDLREAVARARSDADVLTWLQERTDFSRVEEINASLIAPTIGQRMDRPGFIERHPIVTSLPPETTLLAMLDAEDAAMFPA
jgi:hypothetical protein